MAAHLEETGTAQHFGGSSRTSDTPTLSALSQVSGNLTVLWCFAEHANQYTVPAGEGWTRVEARRGTTPFIGLTMFCKVWGLGGQTDDSTPTFTVASTNGNAYYVSQVFSNPGGSWSAVTDALVASAANNAVAATASPAAPSATDTGTERTIVRAWLTNDDNTLNANSEGTLVLGSTTGNFDVNVAGAITVLEGTTTVSSTGTATVTESTNSTDAGATMTLVLTAPAAATGFVPSTHMFLILG